jgi:hypothetical protein
MRCRAATGEKREPLALSRIFFLDRNAIKQQKYDKPLSLSNVWRRLSFLPSQGEERKKRRKPNTNGTRSLQGSR